IPDNNANENTRTFNTIWAKLSEKFPKGVEIGGDTVPLAQFRKDMGKFVSIGGRIVKDENHFQGGTPGRNGEGLGSEPFIDGPDWRQSMFTQNAVRDVLDGALKRLLAEK